MNDETVIIGCGPAGLAIAARLRHSEYPFIVLEESEQVGHTWHQHYDRLHLHTVKQYSNLPLMPFPQDYPTYVSRAQLVDYMNAYAETFEIKPRRNTRITSVIKEGDKWKLTIDQGEDILASHVVIATGVNRIPRIPQWPGQAEFGGAIIHSRYYKNASPFKGQRVLVVGMGNTGAELALDLSESEVDVDLSVRSPISIVPRDLNGQPVQVTSKRLEKLPFGLGDWLGNYIRKVYFGNLEKYGLKESPLPPAVQLKKTGKTPVIDIGTIDAIKLGKIGVRADVRSLSRSIVHFTDGAEIHYDSIILATGYKAGLEFLVPGIEGHLDPAGLPRTPIGSGAWEGLYFIGFDNYKLGGILGTIHTDSALITNHIKKHNKHDE